MHPQCFANGHCSRVMEEEVSRGDSTELSDAVRAAWVIMRN
ncbi:hypothetical protein USDA257_p00860 (plasmid) [Sinorhizobium fredii USDA 257]|uniref:Uncharacterized protein n=1 Tax=Sinorhizobium fredii (strain USDA 257) TaxID=1185652 RepID=I3XFZ8_SINF2|nr:hypothetical protein USDA257_p00860 [Sinorhizobium fredii USDA 257]